MAAASITSFNRTIEKTEIWITDLTRELGWDEPVQEAADLASQLPMLVRGFYYEGWSPSGKPLRERKREEFLAHVASAFRGDLRIDPEQVTRTVFKVIEMHVTSGEVEDVKANLPKEIRALWP